MIASERHIIRKKHKNRKLYKKVDGYCYLYKNLRNATNFIIKQCSRISYKLKQGEILDSWEKYIIDIQSTFVRNCTSPHRNN